MSDTNLHLIDLDQIIRDKAGKKAKYFPRPLRSWLKKVIHQDDLNDYLRTYPGAEGVEFLRTTLEYLDTHLDVRGMENLPDDGRFYTFVSNHPLGGQDGVAIGYILGNHYDGKVKYLVNDFLMNMKGLAPLCIPINKTGKQSRHFPQMVEAGFASDNHIIMFPAGLCSRRQNGVIRDLEWKKTFIAKSVETQRDVVPIHFEGRNSDRFYRIANVCKWLGLKFNIAMLFLVDEMFRNAHSTFRVTIGKPIPWQTFDKSRSQSEWAQYVKEKVYEL